MSVPARSSAMRPGRGSTVFAALIGLACAGHLTPAAGQAPAVALTFDDAVVGLPGSRRPAELFLPPFPDGPRHPAVLVLHGCSGITATVRDWARRVQSWGYAALLVDSFGPRGVENVCNRGQFVPPVLRAGDAFAAAAYLRSRPDIDPDRIAVIGLSHGGSTALVTSTQSAVARLGPRFAAVVALYPWCPGRDAPLASDVLVLIGDADDWTPAARCREQAARWRPELGRLEVHVYPGATHAFDAAGSERLYFGHRLRPDAEVTADAAGRVRRFLAERLNR